MNEELLGFKIRQALEGGLRVSPEIGARLRVARERALDRLQVSASDLALVPAGRAGTAHLSDPRESWVRTFLPVAILIAALFGVHQWQEARQRSLAAAQQTEEFVEVDSGVLTGDLPIKAYLDEDFQAWLKQASE
jgi:hypothetical protein